MKHRLGKREQGAQQLADDAQFRLERILCASYGLYCNRPEVSSEYINDESGAYLALISNLMRGLATQEGNLRLVPNSLVYQQQATGEPTIALLDIMNQQLKRAPRASEQPLSEMLNVPTGSGGAKRVAFTPRIG